MAVGIEDVKRQLNITWSDAHTDRRVEEDMKRAQSVINRAAGREIDLESHDFARQLFFDCCRYMYSDAFAQFKVDYADELLSLRLEGQEDVQTES